MPAGSTTTESEGEAEATASYELLNFFQNQETLPNQGEVQGYRVSLTMHDTGIVGAGSNVQDLAVLMSRGSPSFWLTYDDDTTALLFRVGQCVLLLVTMVILGYWLRVLSFEFDTLDDDDDDDDEENARASFFCFFLKSKHRKKWRRIPWTEWLPERQWLTIMLVGLLFYQDPIYCVLQWVPAARDIGATVPSTSSVSLAADADADAGGIRRNRKRNRRRNRKRNRKRERKRERKRKQPRPDRQQARAPERPGAGVLPRQAAPGLRVGDHEGARRGFLPFGAAAPGRRPRARPVEPPRCAGVAGSLRGAPQAPAHLSAPLGPRLLVPQRLVSRSHAPPQLLLRAQARRVRRPRAEQRHGITAFPSVTGDAEVDEFDDAFDDGDDRRFDGGATVLPIAAALRQQLECGLAVRLRRVRPLGAPDVRRVGHLARGGHHPLRQDAPAMPYLRTRSQQLPFRFFVPRPCSSPRSSSSSTSPPSSAC